MSEAKFTPGPWKCSKKFDFVVVSENEEEIADASYGEYPQANTSLIAAAPDLYDALKSCLNFMENTESELGFSLESADQARAALTKARGES